MDNIRQIVGKFIGREDYLFARLEEKYLGPKGVLVKVWMYTDNHHKMQGPFDSNKMASWHKRQLLPANLELVLRKAHLTGKL